MTWERRKCKKPCQAVANQQSQGQVLCQSAELRAFVQSPCAKFFGPACAWSAFKQSAGGSVSIKTCRKKEGNRLHRSFLDIR